MKNSTTIQEFNKKQPKAESYKGIYSMHKYWSKKPFNIVRYFIENYSKKNDIVLDPFCGSGISNIEAVLTGRRTIGIDINPMAIFIAEQIMTQPNPSIIEQEFRKLKNRCRSDINNLYTTKRNNESFIGTHFIYNNNRLSEIWYKDKNNKKIVGKPDNHDYRLLETFSYDEIGEFYPTTNLIPNSRINAKEGMRVYDLFTPRNLKALAMLLQHINQIPDRKIRDLFRFCFTASIGQSSKMVFVINKRGKANNHIRFKKEVGSWVVGYWLPKTNFEINVWNCFENRFKRIIKAKKEQYAQDFVIKRCNKVAQLDQNNLLLLNTNCYNVLKSLKSNTIDYIITDPPHGDRLPYLELSLMWNSWLKFESDFKNELVISDAKMRNKNAYNYNLFLDKIIRQIERILKPNRYFTLMFNNLDDSTWAYLQKTFSELDLDLIDITTVDYSATSVIQDNRKVGLKTDFAFTFKKTSQKNKSQFEQLDKDELETLVKFLIEEYLEMYDNPPVYKILNHVVISLMSRKIICGFDIIFRVLRNYI